MFGFILIITIVLFTASSECHAITSEADFEAKKGYVINEIKKTVPLSESVIYTEVPRGIILSVAQSALFDGNSTCISQSGRALLDKISDLLNDFDNDYTIESHTEEIILKGEVYKEDWEISIIRASAISRYLFPKVKDASNRLFTIGFGKSMPFNESVAKKDFPNNRVDFVIFDYTVSR